jgi:hypothetical protein
LDRLVGGGRRGHLWFINGPSGVGKTLFALGLARSAVLRAELSCIWLSTDHVPEDLAGLAACAEASVPTTTARSELSEDQRTRLLNAQDEIADALRFEPVSANDLLVAAVAVIEQTPDLAVLVIDAIRDGDVETRFAYLRRLAEETDTWIIAVASHPPGASKGPVWRSQRTVAHLGLWLDRPDLHDPATDRVGEADCTIWAGDSRARSVVFAYQGRMARFVDIRYRQ